ncbi:hypothetical protein [Streptomyces sp. NPDC002215]|uniref:hypothetical protein n=1 Tax=Streptomyces sp. NPDC002215 TaxID=3154412 RepID=UPI0033303F4A
MTNKLTIITSSGLEDAANLEIHIPAHVWAELNSGEAWTGTTAEGDIESEELSVHKVTIRIGG